MAVPASRSVTSPPSNPWSGCQTLPLESVNAADTPALMRTADWVAAGAAAAEGGGVAGGVATAVYGTPLIEEYFKLSEATG